MKTSPAKPLKCFPNCHMTPKEFGVWNYLRSVSHESGIAYLSGDQIAECFADTGGDAIYDIINRLKSKGWIKIFSPSYRNDHGAWVARGGIVLDHAQWVGEFGSAECRPVAKSLQVTQTNLSVNPDLSENSASPVANSRPACRGIPNNIEVDFEVDSEKVVGVEKSARPLSQTKAKAADKESLLSDMRAIYEHHRVAATWNTTPAHEARAVKLAAQYGKRIFLQAFDAWCHYDASEQVETKNYDDLKFPVQKFFGQVEHYKQVAQDSWNIKRRAKPDACLIVQETLAFQYPQNGGSDVAL